MQLLDLPHELLSYIVHFADPDTLCALSLTEKHIPHNIARDCRWRNITVIFGTDPNPKLNIFSFDSGHLEAIRSLSVVVDGDFDASLSSFTLVLPSMTNISHICRPFSSLEELVLDIPVSQDTHQDILQLVPAFPVLTSSHIGLRANKTSLVDILSMKQALTLAFGSNFSRPKDACGYPPCP
ncbi:hypothetical protein EV421DRAFT_1744666 [Armillaria borealis]|uniref:F-box domain-containing protein n=1 Tax=Armillaria borealis TaxID=47425 RepID=A0AA39IU92_9AGAR|nr:hypothetical protein EV421DRAFT_1744666 [Armillaria borealis]